MLIKKAYSVIEVLIVFVVIAILLGSLHLPNVMQTRKKAHRSICNENRRLLRDAEIRYLNDYGYHSKNMYYLAWDNYLSEIPDCPSRGVYSWGVALGGKLDYSKVICSIHGVYP